MTALSTLVDALKRELAVPGTFDDIFPDTSNTDLLGSLADAFGQAQLDGWFPTMASAPVAADVEAGLEPDIVVTPDLSAAGGALVVIIASMRIIRSQLRNLNSAERYKAGNVEYEVQRAASVLKAELDYLAGRMKDLVANAQKQSRASAGMATVFDNYIARGGNLNSGGFYVHEYKG